MITSVLYQKEEITAHQICASSATAAIQGSVTVPNRIIRDAILTSQSVCSLAWPEEVFYRRLMSIVDDYGRSEALPQLLRSRCYPLQTDQVRVADLSRWLAACEKAGLVVLYEVNGKQYLQIEKFGQQQRSASKCPAPDSNCKQLRANALVDVCVDVGVDEFDRAAEAALRAPPSCPHGELINAFAEHLPMLPQPKPELWRGTRERHMRDRWRWVLSAESARGKRYANTPDEAVDFFRRFFGHVAKSDFLTGRNGKWTGCTLAWLMEEANFAKVMEGNFDNDERAAA